MKKGGWTRAPSPGGCGRGRGARQRILPDDLAGQLGQAVERLPQVRGLTGEEVADARREQKRHPIPSPVAADPNDATAPDEDLDGAGGSGRDRLHHADRQERHSMAGGLRRRSLGLPLPIPAR